MSKERGFDPNDLDKAGINYDPDTGHLYWGKRYGEHTINGVPIHAVSASVYFSELNQGIRKKRLATLDVEQAKNKD